MSNFYPLNLDKLTPQEYYDAYKFRQVIFQTFPLDHHKSPCNFNFPTKVTIQENLKKEEDIQLLSQNDLQINSISKLTLVEQTNSEGEVQKIAPSLSSSSRSKFRKIRGESESVNLNVFVKIVKIAAACFVALGGLALITQGVYDCYQQSMGLCDQFVIVHDNKDDIKNGTHFPRIAIVDKKGAYQPVDTSSLFDKDLQMNWRNPHDLESLAKIPNTNNEFITCNSGAAWQSKYQNQQVSTCFHFSLKQNENRWVAYLKKTFPLPIPEEINTFDIESFALDENFNAYWAHRGDNPATVWMSQARFNSVDNTFSNIQTANVSNPVLPKDVRAISDIGISSSGKIMMVGGGDQSDDGPFKGVIYEHGKFLDRIEDLNNKLEAITQDFNGNWVFGSDNEKLPSCICSLDDKKQLECAQLQILKGANPFYYGVNGIAQLGRPTLVNRLVKWLKRPE